MEVLQYPSMHRWEAGSRGGQPREGGVHHPPGNWLDLRGVMRAPSTPLHDMAMRLAAHQAGIDLQSCFILAANALAATLLSPQELFAGDTGQLQTEL